MLFREILYELQSLAPNKGPGPYDRSALAAVLPGNLGRVEMSPIVNHQVWALWVVTTGGCALYGGVYVKRTQTKRVQPSPQDKNRKAKHITWLSRLCRLSLKVKAPAVP